MYKIGIISYTNVLPFLYGLKKMNEIELLDVYPSLMSKYFFGGSIDLALLPVGKMIGNGDVEIVSDYCIGSVGKVDSVCLYAHQSLEKLKRIILDYQSETSVRLVQVLGKEYWKIDVEYIPAKAVGYLNNVSQDTGAVVIGDRTFGLDKRFEYVYDLSEEWLNFTGLPFVFAVWVKKKDNNLSKDFINTFNKALGLGVDNIEEVINFFDIPESNKKQISFYLTNRISYFLDEKKREAIELFSQYVKKLGL